MDLWSIGPAPPASARARTPPAAASRAWPEACINEPKTMANPTEGFARTARAVRAYKERDATQMSVHLVPVGTQIAKFFRHTPAVGTRYDDRSSRAFGGIGGSSHAAQDSLLALDLTPKPQLVKAASPESPSSEPCPAGSPRKQTRVRLP